MALRVGALPDKLYNVGKQYIDDAELENLPRAGAGRSTVYLPGAFPIVLKCVGFPKNQRRLERINQAREICLREGYQDLVIPQARVYREYLVVKRLPITKSRTKEQIGLYCSNFELFTNGVKAFTDLRCRSSIGDLVGDTSDPYQILSQSDLGRYDNVCLYLVDGVGKIGLVDLEAFSPLSKEEQKTYCPSACCDAVQLFSYHLEVILEVAREFDPEVARSRPLLEKLQTEALKRFKLAYEDHYEFITEKGISLEHPAAMVEVSARRKEGIVTQIISFLRDNPLASICWNWICEKLDVESVLEDLMAVLPQIIDLTVSFLSACLERKLIHQGGKIASYERFLSIRTLQLSKKQSLYRKALKNIDSLLGQMPLFDQEIMEGLDSCLLDQIFRELRRGGEIAYYNPHFGTGSHATQCIFL